MARKKRAARRTSATGSGESSAGAAPDDTTTVEGAISDEEDEAGGDIEEEKHQKRDDKDEPQKQQKTKLYTKTRSSKRKRLAGDDGDASNLKKSRATAAEDSDEDTDENDKEGEEADGAEHAERTEASVTQADSAVVSAANEKESVALEETLGRIPVRASSRRRRKTDKMKAHEIDKPQRRMSKSGASETSSKEAAKSSDASDHGDEGDDIVAVKKSKKTKKDRACLDESCEGAEEASAGDKKNASKQKPGTDFTDDFHRANEDASAGKKADWKENENFLSSDDSSEINQGGSSTSSKQKVKLKKTAPESDVSTEDDESHTAVKRTRKGMRGTNRTARSKEGRLASKMKTKSKQGTAAPDHSGDESGPTVGKKRSRQTRRATTDSDESSVEASLIMGQTSRFKKKEKAEDIDSSVDAGPQDRKRKRGRKTASDTEHSSIDGRPAGEAIPPEKATSANYDFSVYAEGKESDSKKAKRGADKKEMRASDNSSIDSDANSAAKRMSTRGLASDHSGIAGESKKKITTEKRSDDSDGNSTAAGAPETSRGKSAPKRRAAAQRKARKGAGQAPVRVSQRTRQRAKIAETQDKGNHKAGAVGNSHEPAKDGDVSGSGEEDTVEKMVVGAVESVTLAVKGGKWGNEDKAPDGATESSSVINFKPKTEAPDGAPEVTPVASTVGAELAGDVEKYDGQVLKCQAQARAEISTETIAGFQADIFQGALEALAQAAALREDIQPSSGEVESLSYDNEVSGQTRPATELLDEKQKKGDHAANALVEKASKSDDIGKVALAGGHSKDSALHEADPLPPARREELPVNAGGTSIGALVLTTVAEETTDIRTKPCAPATAADDFPMTDEAIKPEQNDDRPQNAVQPVQMNKAHAATELIDSEQTVLANLVGRRTEATVASDKEKANTSAPVKALDENSPDADIPTNVKQDLDGPEDTVTEQYGDVQVVGHGLQKAANAEQDGNGLAPASAQQDRDGSESIVAENAKQSRDGQKAAVLETADQPRDCHKSAVSVGAEQDSDSQETFASTTNAKYGPDTTASTNSKSSGGGSENAKSAFAQQGEDGPNYSAGACCAHAATEEVAAPDSDVNLKQLGGDSEAAAREDNTSKSCQTSDEMGTCVPSNAKKSIKASSQPAEIANTGHSASTDVAVSDQEVLRIETQLIDGIKELEPDRSTTQTIDAAKISGSQAIAERDSNKLSQVGGTEHGTNAVSSPAALKSSPEVATPQDAGRVLLPADVSDKNTTGSHGGDASLSGAEAVPTPNPDQILLAIDVCDDQKPGPGQGMERGAIADASDGANLVDISGDEMSITLKAGVRKSAIKGNGEAISRSKELLAADAVGGALGNTEIATTFGKSDESENTVMDGDITTAGPSSPKVFNDADAHNVSSNAALAAAVDSAAPGSQANGSQTSAVTTAQTAADVVVKTESTPNGIPSLSVNAAETGSYVRRQIGPTSLRGNNDEAAASADLHCSASNSVVECKESSKSVSYSGAEADVKPEKFETNQDHNGAASKDNGSEPASNSKAQGGVPRIINSQSETKASNEIGSSPPLEIDYGRITDSENHSYLDNAGRSDMTATVDSTDENTQVAQSNAKGNAFVAALTKSDKEAEEIGKGEHGNGRNEGSFSNQNALSNDAVSTQVIDTDDKARSISSLEGTCNLISQQISPSSVGVDVTTKAYTEEQPSSLPCPLVPESAAAVEILGDKLTLEKTEKLVRDAGAEHRDFPDDRSSPNDDLLRETGTKDTATGRALKHLNDIKLADDQKIRESELVTESVETSLSAATMRNETGEEIAQEAQQLPLLCDAAGDFQVIVGLDSSGKDDEESSNFLKSMASFKPNIDSAPTLSHVVTANYPQMQETAQLNLMTNQSTDSRIDTGLGNGETSKLDRCENVPSVDVFALTEIPEPVDATAKHIMECGPKLKKRRKILEMIKIRIFSEGSQVHGRRGYEKLFAEYWSALTMRLESHEFSDSNSRTCDAVLDSFLKTRKLRKLHNRLVFGTWGEEWLLAGCICWAMI